jgi:hypothetical protein
MDIPRRDDPFWDTSRNQANGLIRKVIREDDEIVEIYVEFYDNTSAFYSIDTIEGCYTLRYGVGGWEV